MQEGGDSLDPDGKNECGTKAAHDAGPAYFSVLTVDGKTAMLGDVILAEPECLIGLGQRVIEQTICRKLPKGFQSAEFALGHGLIDAIVERKETEKSFAQTDSDAPCLCA